jgi:hypothetical protein
VRIERDPHDIFDMIADPLTYPRWDAAVETVRPLTGGRRKRFSMQRLLPFGRIQNTVDVVTAAPLEEVVVEASDGPLPFTYRYLLVADGGATEVFVEGEVAAERVPSFLEAAAVRMVRRSVDANLGALRRLLERDAARAK